LPFSARPSTPGLTPGRKHTIVRRQIMPACLVLAWCILPLVAVAGLTGPGHLVAQPSTGTAVSSTATSVASSTRAVPASASAPAATTEATAARPAATWTVRPGDTLSAIAAALGTAGGWPALYAANKRVIGPDPDLIRPGTVLAVPARPAPARPAPARYAVAPGDTLSAVAAALAVPGGWPALYAANKTVIGPDPDLIRAGTVLTVPRPPAPAAPATAPPAPPAPPAGPARPATAPAGSRPVPRSPDPAGGQPAGHPAAPGQATAPGNAAANGRRAAPGRLTGPAGGMPRWLQDVLLAAGVLAATAFIAEPAAALARRRRAPGRPARPGRRRGPRAPAAAAGLAAAGPGAARGARRAAGKARIVFADHERLIVTYCAADHAAYVLTPPGEDPGAVLRAARLVLPEDTYQDLAGHLGLPAGWPLE
jgi:LysM repeat protein